MKKSTKIWSIIAASLMLVGIIIFSGVMTMLNWDFKKLSTVRYETNSYEIGESYANISIKTSTADITVLPSEDGTTRVVCYEQINIKHSVSVKDDTLCIEVKDTRKWYEYIGINFGFSQKVTVYLPRGDYGNLTVNLSTGDTRVADNFNFDSINISASTGDISVNNTTANSIWIKTTTGDIALSNINCQGEITTSLSTGDVMMSNVNCGTVTSNGSTGDLRMSEVIANNKIYITRSTGDITLGKCDANEIYIKVSTGNVTGTLLSDKIFIATTDTGNVSVPHSGNGGRCEIRSSTGDITIMVQK